ncbi:MAG TPA: hypothetical protein VNN62_25060 [Methylomirabilota bacterium]|nr:hypothetical protein [Methylomirabilota bacterium]
MNDEGEVYEEGVTQGLDHAPMMLGNGLLNKLIMDLQDAQLPSDTPSGCMDIFPAFWWCYHHLVVLLPAILRHPFGVQHHRLPSRTPSGC